MEENTHLNYDDLETQDVAVHHFHMRRASERMKPILAAGAISAEAAKEELAAFEQKLIRHLLDTDSNAGQLFRTEYETANPRLGTNESTQWSR